MAIGSDSVVVGFFSVGIRLGFRRDSSESDDNRVESGQILSDSVEFRRNPSRIPTERNPTTGYRIRSTFYGKCRILIKSDADPIVSDRIYKSD